MKRLGGVLLFGLLAVALAGCGADLGSIGGYPDVRILSDVLTPTAGPPSIVEAAWQRTEAFAARIPAGWQAETPPAWASTAAVFRAGPCTTLTVTLRPYASRVPRDCKDTPLRFVLRGDKVNGEAVLVVAMMPIDDWPLVESAFTALAASVRAP
ncbi:MAG TPA: hypothetical protein VER79_00025 [Candidatus Limnocylindrales bacterium]|nr:hypothetical protein [Candidatus Limnocylindrales bacterium]